MMGMKLTARDGSEENADSIIKMVSEGGNTDQL